MRVLKATMIGAGLLAACIPALAAAAPPGVDGPAPGDAGLLDRELETALRAAMPLPVLRVTRWRELDRSRYVVEMSLASVPDAPSPAMHVTFHIGENSDRAELAAAIDAAAQYARGFVAGLAQRPKR